MSRGSCSKEVIRDLVEGKLPWAEVKSLISGHKDDDRFEKYVAVLQQKVSWRETILLPLTDELYIVQKGEDRIVKCGCGHEFGDYRENWKLKALIYVRKTKAELDELFPYPSELDPEYCEIREHCCPGCGTQLEVDVVPFGYPAVFDFLPDLDSFYREWLRKPLSEKKEFKDLTVNVVKKWAR